MEKDKNQSDVLKQKISNFCNVLTKSIEECNAVYLVGHKTLDFDAIASLGAMGLICKSLKKAPYIVIDQEEIDKINDDKEKFYEREMIEKIKEKFVVINLTDYRNNKQDNSLLIVLDTNKGFKTPMKNDYDDFKRILVLDHHKEGEDSIKCNHKLILNECVSSCSEMLYWFLKQYDIIPSDVDYYNFLLIGIYLDTKKLLKANTMDSTRDCVKELEKNYNVDLNRVNLFLNPSLESLQRSAQLLTKATWLTVRYAIAVDNNETYTKNEVSRAADMTTDIVCEAAIFCGKNKDGKYEVSARSNRGNVDIAYIMHELNGGGGSAYNAACEPIFIDADGEMENEILLNRIKDIIYLKHDESDSKIPRKSYSLNEKKSGK